jgi:hypothetical protein
MVTEYLLALGKNAPFVIMAAADWSMRSPTAYDSPISWPTEPFPSYGVWLVEQL